MFCNFLVVYFVKERVLQCLTFAGVKERCLDLS